MILLLVACHKVPEAPAEIEDLCAWLFAHQDEPELLPDGLTKLQTWLATRTESEEGYQLPPLEPEDVADVDRPDRDLTDALGGVGDAVSPHSLQSHVDFILLADQSVVDPGDYSKFDRTFLVGGDCFGARDCERTETWNDIVKTAAFGVTIPYEYPKDYQWVDFVANEGDTRAAVVSRGSVAEESFDESGNNGILQSFTLDVFLERPTGDLHRVQALWTETKLVIDDIVTEDFLRKELAKGLQDVFADTDAAIEELGL